MAPLKRENIDISMFDSPRKRIKAQNLEKQISSAFFIPDDVVEIIFSFFPIKNAVQAGLVSTRFKDSWLLSRHLDFGRDFAENHFHFEAIEIIERVFERHQGPKIQKLVLFMDHTNVQSFIESWIQKSVDKGLEELELDFIKTGSTMRPTLDLSSIESLRVLKLSLCHFYMPTSPKGLKLLKTLVLSLINVSAKLIDAVFKNCVCIETLELHGCKMIQELKIRAGNHKRFRSLVAACCPQLLKIDLDAPTLESFKYCGQVYQFRFVNVIGLKEAVLHYIRIKDYTLAFRVVSTVFGLSRINVLTTTSVFLEGLSRRIVEGVFKELAYRFWNLKEFQIFMEGPSYVNLFDFACFFKNCPSLERVYIDINDFTFEIGLYWEVHQKPLLDEYPYKLNSIKFVEIKGFKCHSHELDMVQFFLEKATYLDTLVLVTPRKKKTRFCCPDLKRICAIKKMSPRVKIRVYEDSKYKRPISPKHVKEWEW